MPFLIAYGIISGIAYIVFLLYIFFTIDEANWGSTKLKPNWTPIIIYGVLAIPTGWFILMAGGLIWLIYKLCLEIGKIEKMQPTKPKKEWE